MNRYEVMITEAFILIASKILLPALLLTAMLGVLAKSYLCMAGRERYDYSPIKWIFHKWVRISLVLGILSVILYSTIFAYSIRVWRGMPAKKVFEETLTDRELRGEMPLSNPVNLIGVSKNEIEGVFGDSVREGIMDQYEGTNSGGERYSIKVFYMPFFHRVLYYETLVQVG